MFNWKKPITQEVIEVEEAPIKTIHLTEREFHDYIIDYESGKMEPDIVLIFFCYIIQWGKWERCRYSWLTELIEHEVLTDEGYVNPQKLKVYRDTKAKTRITF